MGARKETGQVDAFSMHTAEELGKRTLQKELFTV